MGSNPILSAKKSSKLKGFLDFSFSRQGVDLAKNAGNPALFRLFFARLLEPAMSEKPYISRLFGVALIFCKNL